jgi:hypothetical protein
MAEVVLGVILLLSLFGNYQQHKHAQATDQELTYWQDQAELNRQQWLNVIEVNKDNATVINNLEQAVVACEIRQADTINRINDFRQAAEFKDAALADLRTRLGAVDFGTCRVPDWVSFGDSYGRDTDRNGD